MGYDLHHLNQVITSNSDLNEVWVMPKPRKQNTNGLKNMYPSRTSH